MKATLLVLVIVLLAIVPVDAQDTVQQSPSFTESDCPFLTPYGFSFTCGTVEVPAYYADLSKGTLKLHVTIIHSLMPTDQPPLVIFPGGPGNAATLRRDMFIELPFVQTSDVVLLDPRGAGLSEPSLDCFEVQGVGQYYETQVGAYRDCHDRLLQNGIDVNAYTTSANAEDVYSVARALDYPTINIHSGSYGTRVALELAQTHPDLIHAMILDGVLPLDAFSILEEPQNTQRVFDAIFAACAADADCNARYPDLPHRFREILARYNANPFPEDVGYGSGDDLAGLMFTEIYGSAARIPAFITALYNEDLPAACNAIGPLGYCESIRSAEATSEPTSEPASDTATATPETAAADYDWRAHFTDLNAPSMSTLETFGFLVQKLGLPSLEALFTYFDGLDQAAFEALIETVPREQVNIDDFSEGVFASVMCGEELQFYSLDDIARVAERVTPQLRGLTLNRAKELLEICGFWGASRVSLADKIPAYSTVPTLIFNGTFDPITAPQWAARAGASLANDRIVLFPGIGHVVLATKNACAVAIAIQFYADPAASLDTSCIAGVIPVFD